MVELGRHIEEARNLPYVKAGIDLKGRSIFLLPFYDTDVNEWFAFFETEPGRFQRVALVDIDRGAYLASVALDEACDLCLPLHDLVFQRMSFPKMGNPIMGLEDAVENACSVLEFYRIVSELYAEGHPGASQLAQSLVSQLFVVSRSLYDSLQMVCRVIATYFRRLDDTSKPLMKKLPTSFAEVALRHAEPRTADEISTRYDMPPPLAKLYGIQAPFLASVKRIRDKVIHRGHHVGFALNLDEGLAVRTTDPPWDTFDIWEGAVLGENQLGSLRRLFAHVLLQSLAATTRFAEAVFSCIALPEPVSPGNHIYLRSPLNHYIMELEQAFDSPWERV